MERTSTQPTLARRSIGLRFLHWLFSWKTVRCALIALVGLVTLIFLTYAIENWRGKHAWEAHKRILEGRGERFNLAQLAPPPVPDEQNFVMTPLLKPVLEYSRESGCVVWKDTNGYARLNHIGIELSDKNRTNRPVLGNLEKGTFTDLPATREFYRGHPDYPQPAKPGKPAEDILVALGKFDAEINELRQAAATRPYSRFPVEYDYQPAVAILLPHLAAIKRLSQITELRALARLDLGQSQEALDDFKLEMRLGDSIRNEPILISHLVRVALAGFNLLILREGVVRHAWSDAQLQEIQKSFAAVDLLTEYKVAMRGERALSVSVVDWLRQQGFAEKRGNFFEDGQPHDGLAANVYAVMPSGWYYQNMRTMSEMFEEFTLPVVDENAHRVSPELMEQFESIVNGRPGPYRLFVRVFIPALGNVAKKTGRMQAWLDAGRVACALERYRLAAGRLPGSLDELVPKFIEAIPTDVIDGKPLRYQLKSDGGYVVYSVGWNRVDDGGQRGLKESPGNKESLPDFTRGDWVWKMPASLAAADTKR